MNAVHIRTDGMHCDECPPMIEAQIEQLPGVREARTYRSLRLTSVLYDPELTDSTAISDRITRAGFEAHVLTRSRDH